MDTTKQWFNYLHTERNLSVKVIGDACLKINDNKLEIPIFDKDGIHLFSKYRKEPWSNNNAPKYTYEVGSHVALYGQHFSKQSEVLFLTEGECYDDTAEILTTKGWKLFKKLEGIDKVAAINDKMEVNFEKPLAIIKKRYKGNLIEYKDTKKYYSLTTPDHNLVSFDYKNRLRKFKAKEGTSICDDIPRAVIYDTNDCSFSLDEIRFIVMISADFTIRKEGDIYGGLKKERKIKRFKEICEKLNIPYSCRVDKSGKHSCFIKRGDAPKYVVKEFNHEWISQFSKKQRDIFLDEILYWDGNSVPNRNQIEFSSKYHTNAIFVQTMAHLSGYVSTIMSRQNKFGEWFKVSILFGKSKTSWQGKKNDMVEVPYDGYVYCATVSTGMILVRQKDCIVVSGNCDAMAMRTIGYDAYSSTGGAMSWQRDWTLDYIERVPTVLFDNDEAGINGAVKTILILGEATYSWIPPAYGKDISDVLSNKGVEFCQKMLEDPIRKIYININKLTTKKSITEKKKEFQEISKSLDYNTVGQKFMSAMIKKMQELEKSYTPKKQAYIPTGNNDKERAKSYPIRNLIKVGEHGENKNKAYCPFHKNGAERTPSAHIYPDNTLFCHGCGKYADVIDIYMAQNNLSGPAGFKEAISQLTNKI